MKKLSLISFSLFFLLSCFSVCSCEYKKIQGYAQVIDGDSIIINNKKIRLFGIDAPEKNQICKKNGTSMRIGTNHGSLSDRIMSRYGDTPLGMVESAMEFIRIAEDERFFDIESNNLFLSPRSIASSISFLSS